MDAYEACTEVGLEMHKRIKSTNHPNMNNLYQILNELHLLINCEEYYVVDLIEILLDYDVALEDKMQVAIMTGFDTYNFIQKSIGHICTRHILKY